MIWSKRPMVRTIVGRGLGWGIAALLAMLWSHTSTAQDGMQRLELPPDTLRLSVCDAILMALEHNPTIGIRRLDPDIRQSYVGEERAVFDPAVQVSAQQSEAKSQRRLGSQPTPFDLRDEQVEASVEVAQVLPTGTSLTARAGMTGSVSNLYTDQNAGTVGITISQSLLRGFGTVPTLARLRKARLDVAISDAELRGLGQQVTAEVERSYWEVHLSGQEVMIQQESLDLARRQRDESLERVRVGRLARLELAAVEAEVASREGALIDAQSRHEQARLRFLHAVSPDSPPSWSTALDLIDIPFVPSDSLHSPQHHEEVAREYRPDLQEARLALEKGDIDVSQTKNGLLPRLDLFISLGRTVYAQSFQEAYPDLDSPYYQASGGVSLALPVLNRAPSSALRRARLSHQQQALAVQNMERLAGLDVRVAHVEVRRARQQIDATRLTRELQEKKLEAEVEKFRVGKSTNFLVLQAQRDLTASLLGEARAKVAYLTAWVQLYVAEGTLLDRRGIENFGA